MGIVRYIKNLLVGINYEPKLAFTKTREQDMGRSTFKVSLGVMPDYTYTGQGILVEGVSQGKAAQKAGILKGDVLMQLGNFPFTEIQSYMSALNKFEKGETTTVKLKRGDQVLEMQITF